MDLAGEYRIAAPREVVWAALNDAEVLKACIPGCVELNKTTETTMDAIVALKIGPVKAKFSGAVELQDIDAPKGYTIQGEGNGGVAGFAKGSAEVLLTEDGDETVLSFTSDAKVGGKLAQIGSRLINSTAKKLANKFFDNFHDHFNHEVPPD